MKIALFSDLHREVSKIDVTPLIAQADIVVLAGDIDEGLNGVVWAKQLGKPVVYVPGNHEYDNHEMVSLNEKFAQDHGDVHVLLNKQWVFNGVRFLGCTLWTDFEFHGYTRKDKCMQECQRGMPDYKAIMIEQRKLTAQDTLVLHRYSRDWLKTMLNTPFDGDTVVVTHHAPHASSIAPYFKHDWMTGAFASHCDYLMGRPFLWIHGHTHEPVDYWVQDTRIVSHPRGYFQCEDQVPTHWKYPMLVDTCVNVAQKRRKNHIAGVLSNKVKSS